MSTLCLRGGSASTDQECHHRGPGGGHSAAGGHTQLTTTKVHTEITQTPSVADKKDRTAESVRKNTSMFRHLPFIFLFIVKNHVFIAALFVTSC